MASCIPIPPFPTPPSISPLTIGPPALPPVDISVDLCCRVNLISYTPIIPLGPAILAIPGASAVVAAIQVATATIKAYLAALPLKCPRE